MYVCMCMYVLMEHELIHKSVINCLVIGKTGIIVF
jgi:hypothetical protein